VAITATVRNFRRIAAITLLALVLCTLAWKVWALNVFEGWDKAPTFNPPPGCIPTVQNYGVTAQCETTHKPGRRFFVLIDAARGTFFDNSSPQKRGEMFVSDHVVEMQQNWEENVGNPYPNSALTFSSRASSVIPGNAPQNLTTCKEYSINFEIKETIDGHNVPVKWRVEGLTCGWGVERPESGVNVELFWLEVFDSYAPTLGQMPTVGFEPIVRDVFASARL
jgi:hypothetical protein